jgi:hypothetical protein
LSYLKPAVIAGAVGCWRRVRQGLPWTLRLSRLLELDSKAHSYIARASAARPADALHVTGQSARGGTGDHKAPVFLSRRSGHIPTCCWANEYGRPPTFRKSRTARTKPAQNETNATVGIGPSPSSSSRGWRQPAHPCPGS